MAEKQTHKELEQKVREPKKQVAGKESLQKEDGSKTIPASLEKDTGKMAPKQILVVDDSEIDRMVLEEILKQAGCKVFSASDGKEGIELFNQNPIDLVITDMVMPEKMGIDLILELREKCPDLKIIAMSAGGDFGPEIDLDMAKRFGATRVVTKPFKVGEILTAVKELLRKRKPLLEPETTTASGGQDGSKPAAENPVDLNTTDNESTGYQKPPA